jgi:hypothetical protein
MQGDTCTDEPVIRNAKKKNQLLVSSNQEDDFIGYRCPCFQFTTIVHHYKEKQ